MASFFFHIVVLALATFAYRLHQFRSKYYESSPCGMDPPIEIDGVWFRDGEDQNYVFQDPCSLYSTEYFQARNKFREAVKKFNGTTSEEGHAELWSSVVISKDDDDSASLTIDVAVLPGNSQDLGTIVHSSGVHGIEGYSGSAVQMALLELFTAKPIDPRDRPTIVMLHGVNPVGMKEWRRCNENNVDLNRNGIVGSFEKFVGNRDPNVAGYEDFRDIFVPQMDVDRTSDDMPLYDRTIGFFAALIPAVIQYGLPALKKGIVAGQYHHPEGLNYGGVELQTSVQRLLEIFVQDRPEFFRDSSHLVWIDVHTGLGPFGQDSVLRYAHVEHPDRKGKKPEIDDYFTKAFSITSKVDGGESTANAFKGYDLTKGMLMDFLGDYYHDAIIETDDAHSKAGIFILQEFGTIPAILVGRALILDNMFYNFRKARHQKRAKPDEEFLYRSPLLGSAFYPQSTEWRSSIVKRGVALVLQSMEYSVARAKSRS